MLKKQQEQYESGSREYQKIQSKIEGIKVKSIATSNKLATAINDLTGKQRKLIESYDALQPEIDKVNNEIKQNTDIISDNREKVDELTKSLDINRLTVGQLKKEAAQLRAQLQHVIPDTPEARELEERLAAVRDRLSEVNDGANGGSNSFGDLADKFNQYAGIITAAIGTLAGLTLSIQEVIDRNNEMTDAMSAVEKTTGMARSEVEELARSFSDFDTRTKKIDLLKISEVGGRLGVAKSEIKEFTREVDKANVALGDSWSGGIDNLADSLGRISSLYKETKDQPIAVSINQVGSALNELAAQGASSEQNIADFVTRLGALPPAMKPPLNTLLGFGSALEESGINAEIGASGFGKFIRVASTGASSFAQIMKLPVSQVKEMINTNPAEFFLKFSEGLKGLDTVQLGAVLDQLKLTDNEVQRVIGAATENTDRFRESVDVASKSVKEGTSLQNEFNKVNNNAAAIYEKVRRKVAESFTSKAIAQFLEKAVTMFGQFIGVVEDANGAMTWYRNTLMLLIKIVTVATATFYGMNVVTGVYNGLMKTAYERVLGLTVIEKARNLITAASNGLTTLYTASLLLLSAGYNAVSGNTLRAAASMRLFNATLAANPVGAVVTLVTILASAFFLLQDNTEDAVKEIKSLNYEAEMSKKVLDEQAKSVGELKSKIDPLISVLKDEKSQLADRKRAYEDLIKIHPEFKGTLDAEYRATNKLSEVYDGLISKIKAAAQARALQSMLEEQYAKKEKLEAVNDNVKKEQTDLQPTTITTIGGKKVELKGQINPQDIQKAKIIDGVATGINQKLEEVNSNIDLTVKKIASLAEKPDDKSNYNVPDPDAEKAEKERKKAEKERLAAEKKEQREAQKRENERNKMRKEGEDAAQLARELEVNKTDAVIEAMQEGYEKEIAQIDIQEKRKKVEIDKKRVGQTEFDILQKKIDNAKGDDKILFQALMKSWKDNNQALDEYKDSLQQISESKRQAARFKNEQKTLSEQQKAHDTEVAKIQQQYNEEIAKYKTLADLKQALQGRIESKELNKIKTWSEGREALQKLYNKREIELQIAHLSAMVKIYEGIDLSLLTEDQRKEVMKFIDEAGNKIAEFKAKAAGQNQDKEEKSKGDLGKDTNADILGLNQSQWAQMFDNFEKGTDMLGTMQGAVMALQNAFSVYYKFVEANERRQLQTYEKNTDAKKKKLKQQLDAGIIRQDTYKKLTLEADTALDKKKAEISVRSAKRERNMQIASIIGNTALGIMKVWADPGYPQAIPLSVVIGALGAVQLGTVLSTPLPTAEGYESGFNTESEYPIIREQDGRRFKVKRRRLSSGLVDRPTHFIAGENAVEMVIDNPTWTSYSPALKEAIYTANARARGYEGGYNTIPKNDNTRGNDDDIMLLIVQTLNKTNEVMEKIQTDGIPSYILKNARNGKDFVEMAEEYQKLVSKNKH